MEGIVKKCAFEDHKEKEAKFYCIQCGINMCIKCENFHSKLCKHHKIIPLEQNIAEIFTGLCKEKNHNNSILHYFCKTHNQLCCSECIIKIKNNFIGKHSNCEIDLIENIKEEKLKTLNNNIKNLEEFSKSIDSSIKELKDIYEKINKNKEELKIKIAKIFTEIRTELNNREDELLSEIDKKYDELYFKEELIKESEKLPNKIKINLEKGKEITDNNNNNNNLNYIINDCINIENNINIINNINYYIEKSKKSYNIEIIFQNTKEKELKEIIKLFGKIEINKDNLFKDFNIQNKKPIHILKFHTDYICCLTILNDGRLVSGSRDTTIIVYNKITFQPDIIIKLDKENKDNYACSLIQLSSGELVSGSKKIITIFKIKEKQYEVLKRLNVHGDLVLKIIELKNKNVVSCSNSNDASIIFYNKDNMEQNNPKINTKGGCYTILQIKENEICYIEGNNSTICFYDFQEKKIKSSLANISVICRGSLNLIMISENLLLIPGENKISLININEYKIIKIIEVPDSNWILGVCALNKNMILTGDYSKAMNQWKIEGDNIKLIAKKEKAHNDNISLICNLGNGYIASGSDNSSIIIW